MARPTVEVAGIFRRHGKRYREQHPLPVQQQKLMRAIETCRTAELGGHVERCSHCPHQRIAYNSCRNRHCPKCQNLERGRWLERRKAELLPVEYFHVVFTIPEQLNALALQNKAILYRILFQASAQTLLTIAADPRHLGVRVGFFSILHTWGQNLLLHPHVHCVVTGGGLSADGGSWVSCRPGFLLSVHVLSRLFRRLFLEELDQAFQNGKLSFHGKLELLDEPRQFQQLLSTLRAMEWVVYAKPPFGGPDQVLDYLGRYTHRVAISNNRLLSEDQEQVRFRYKNYRAHQSQQKRTMTLAAGEFIRRFLLHTIPPGFQRIRHYGLLASRTKRTTLSHCRQLLGVSRNDLLPTAADIALSLPGLTQDLLRCPECGIGQMLRIETIPPPRIPLLRSFDSS
jgi:Putative transposase/Transposase zinc-binding domain